MTYRSMPRHNALALATIFLSSALLLTAGCGGGSGTGGGGTDDGGGLEAPSNLAYALAAILVRTDAPIAPNAPSYDGDAPTNWSVTPALPDGLILDANTGMLTGTPTTQTASNVYTVTAFNAAGGDSANVTIEILWSEEKSIAAKANPSDDDLRHFMHRTHFGFSQPHWDVLQAMIVNNGGDTGAGLAEYVTAMTTITQQAALEQAAHDAYLVDGNDPDGNFPTQNDLANWWLHMIMFNQNPFQEVLALHWHDHFATSTDALPGQGQRHYFIAHVNLLRNQGAGNLRDLLLALAEDSAMLEWLDGVRNNAGGNNEPNENFGREWLELFCLGVDVLYNQTDIVEASRAFSGYQSFFDSNTGLNFTAPNINRHDQGAKTLLGVPIPAGQTIEEDYASVADITVNAVDPVHGRSACARWIIRNLLRRFVYENPPENVINDLAEILENNGFELQPMLEAMFKSEAFFCARAKNEGFVTTPTEGVFTFIRTTTLTTFPQFLRNPLLLMGNLPTRPPVVDGWPEGTSWYSAQGMIDRANLLEFLVADSAPVQPDVRLILPAGTPDAGECIDALALRMRVSLTPAERAQLVTYMNTDTTGGGQTPDPFDINDQDHIDERVRGVIYIMGQHPTALTR